MRVIVEGHHTGRIAGTPFDVGFVHVWTLKDGHAGEFREYMDSGKLVPLFASRTTDLGRRRRQVLDT